MTKKLKRKLRIKRERMIKRMQAALSLLYEIRELLGDSLGFAMVHIDRAIHALEREIQCMQDVA